MKTKEAVKNKMPKIYIYIYSSLPCNTKTSIPVLLQIQILKKIAVVPLLSINNKSYILFYPSV